MAEHGVVNDDVSVLVKEASVIHGGAGGRMYSDGGGGELIYENSLATAPPHFRIFGFSDRKKSVFGFRVFVYLINRYKVTNIASTT